MQQNDTMQQDHAGQYDRNRPLLLAGLLRLLAQLAHHLALEFAVARQCARYNDRPRDRQLDEVGEDEMVL